MSEKRPLSVLVYCGVLALLIAVGAISGALSLMVASDVPPNIADAVLAFAPLLIAIAGLAGMWRMRWWGVAVLWLCVLSMIGLMLFVPFHGDTEPFLSALAMNAAIWFGVIAFPPTVIAFSYRRRFR